MRRPRVPPPGPPACSTRSWSTPTSGSSGSSRSPDLQASSFELRSVERGTESADQERAAGAGDRLFFVPTVVWFPKITMSASSNSQDFKPNRSLLNPKFEGYKFNPLPQDDLTRRYGLQYKPSQTSTSASRSTQPMSFQEVQSRITHNHLTVRPDSALGVYVDVEHRVIGVTIDPVSERTSCFPSRATQS